MRFRALVVILYVILGGTVVFGMATQNAQGQTYTAVVDFAIHTSGFVGQQLEILGTITVLEDRNQSDTITITLIAPDTGFNQTEVFIPVTAEKSSRFPFQIAWITFTKGAFTLIVESELVGEILRDTFPVPGYRISASISETSGEIGTEFVVETLIDIGDMTIVLTRFDIQYIVDGVMRTQSEVAILIDPRFLPPQYSDYGEWRVVQTFAFEPGDHTLEVRVIDLSIGEEVFSKTFTIRVMDQFQAIEDRLAELEATIISLESNVTLFGVDVSAVKAEIEDLKQEIEAARLTFPTVGERLDDLEARLEELEGRAVALERVSAVTTPVAWLSLVAIVLSSLSLLVQFGILKFKGRGEE